MAACCYPLGPLTAILSGDWVVNTAHVYGGLPLPLALAASWLAYGSLLGLEIVFFLGLPFLLGLGRPGWQLVLIPLWAAVLQVLAPRFLFWTFGQFMFPVLPLVQSADVIGSAGLNFLLIPVHLVLAAWASRLVSPASIPLRPLKWVSLAVCAAMALNAGYGFWRLEQLESAPPGTGTVRVVVVQPNFSLRALASNPALSPAARQRSLATLLEDSSKALAALESDSADPVVVIWPESVYPRPYFLDPATKKVVRQWVRAHEVHLVLTTQDAAFRKQGTTILRDHYGAAVHVQSDGETGGLYRKIALIPFGETIPLADVIPGLRLALKTWIPRISEFTRGTKASVFTIAPGIRLAPMICFDATVEDIARRMTANGANLGLVLANLAWFGRTSISDQFARFVQFRAIENRIPIILASQNGVSLLLEASGREGAARLEQFEQGTLTLRLALPEGGSFYASHGPWINAAYRLLLAVLLGFLWRNGRYWPGKK